MKKNAKYIMSAFLLLFRQLIAEIINAHMATPSPCAKILGRWRGTRHMAMLLRRRRNAKKFLYLVSAVIATAFFALSAVHASAMTDNADELIVDSDNDSEIESEVILHATAWLEGNYGEFYHLKSVKADVVRVFDLDSETRYTVALSCQTMLKFDSVDELPFVQGLYSALDDRNASPSEVAAVDYYVDNAIDVRFGVWSYLSVDVVIVIDKTDTQTPWTMYYQDGMDTTLYDIRVLTLDAESMYNEGRNSASYIIATYADIVKRLATRAFAARGAICCKQSELVHLIHHVLWV